MRGRWFQTRERWFVVLICHLLTSDICGLPWDSSFLFVKLESYYLLFTPTQFLLSPFGSYPPPPPHTLSLGN